MIPERMRASIIVTFKDRRENMGLISTYTAAVFIISLIVLTVVIKFMSKLFGNDMSWVESGVTALVAVTVNTAVGMLLMSVVSPV